MLSSSNTLDLAHRTQGKKDEVYLEALARVVKLGQQVDQFLEENHLDAMIFPSGTGTGADASWAPAIASSGLLPVVCPPSIPLVLTPSLGNIANWSTWFR